MAETCPSCLQTIQQAHKEHLNKHKLTMLKAAARVVIESGENDFRKTDMRRFMPDQRNDSNYANFPKLRYHGLIFKGENKGDWGITRNGWAFLRGTIELPKYVLVRNNHIVERCPETFHVTDVYRGSDVVETSFEYFDEDGNMVGVRPSKPVDMQTSLL